MRLHDLKGLRDTLALNERRAHILAKFRPNPQGWAHMGGDDVPNQPAAVAAAPGEQWSMGRMNGTIKRIQKDRAFGFIKGQDGQDYFFHKSGLGRGVEFNHLEEGQAVQFEATDGAKGPRAEEIELA
jgi:CspA family cold shock protein